MRDRLCESLDELERLLGHVPPAGVDRQRVPAAGHLDDAVADAPHEAARHSSPDRGFATPVWCGAWFGPNPTSGQYAQVAGTQRKTSPAAATWQTDGNDK